MSTTIGALPLPIRGIKCDWGRATRGIGFTPLLDTIRSRAAVRSTVHAQTHGGLVLEYITRGLPDPREGERQHTPEERAEHRAMAGRLIAVHELDCSQMVHSRDVWGDEYYMRLQRRWDTTGKGLRWSCFFPIVRTWEVIDPPDVHSIFSPEECAALFNHNHRWLQPITEQHRALIADIVVRAADVADTVATSGKLVEMAAIENEANGRPRFSLAPSDRDIAADHSAVEGRTREVVVRLAMRDRKIVRDKKRAGPLLCERCGYDPASRGADPAQARRCLDVHHLNPLETGERLTRLEDLAILCPTCHREAHAGLDT